LFGLDSRPAAEALPLLRLFNDETAALVARHPDRFSGLAALPFDDLGAAAAEYRRARTELGLIGAILPNNFFLDIGRAAGLGQVFDAAEALGGHLFVHPGRRPDEAGAIDRAGETRYPDNVMPRRQLEIQHQVAQAMVTLIYGDVIDGYDNFSIHIANIGGTLPLVIERIAETARLRAPEAAPPLARLGRLYVDTSSMGPRAIEAAVAIYGADRVVLGSDCPIYSTEFSLGALDAAAIAPEARNAVRTGNAARLLDDLLGRHPGD
ncbi:MAG: amidohydrolase family protein, partial [Alphaproteobacteria bacterium]|nr:amidohydrolase family protein [Alphaproteobacteria bacterium]